VTALLITELSGIKLEHLSFRVLKLVHQKKYFFSFQALRDRECVGTASVQRREGLKRN